MLLGPIRRYSLIVRRPRNDPADIVASEARARSGTSSRQHRKKADQRKRL
jgi:hypothetical protein